MSDLLNESDFTKELIHRLGRFNLDANVPEPLVIELHYGEEEPVLTMPLRATYERYMEAPHELNDLLNAYVTEIGWTVQPPRYPARQIFDNAVPIMKDILVEPIAQDGESTVLDGKEIVLRLPKGPLLYQDLVSRPEEHLIIQYMMDVDTELVELHRGDVLTCFPEPGQIAYIAIQNLGKRALMSGLTTRVFKVENFHTEPFLVGFRNPALSEYVASLINVSDVMLALERNLEASEGMLVIVPSRDQMLVSTNMDDQAVCEMWLLARHLKKESSRPVSGLIWRFRQGEITAVQTVNLQEEG